MTRVGARKLLLGRSVAVSGIWTPALPTTDGGVLPHTWHYAGSGTLFQDAAKTVPAVGNGDVVGASENQGSDVHDITQAVTANKPTLRLNVLNGEPVLRFDGTDYLASAFAGGALSQPYMYMLVAQLDAGSVNDGARHVAIGSSNATGPIQICQHEAPNPDVFALYAGNFLDGAVSTANWNLWTTLFNGVASQFWFSGISQAIGNPGANNPVGITLGRANWGAAWVGDIPEVLLYDPSLSTADHNQVGQYLATKYGLAWVVIP